MISFWYFVPSPVGPLCIIEDEMSNWSGVTGHVAALHCEGLFCVEYEAGYYPTHTLHSPVVAKKP
jgi:hypothetical protein